MKLLTFSAAAFILTATTLSGFQPDKVEAPVIMDKKTAETKIQAAILLDVSGSMGGLIEQAKIQLWNMVSVMGRAKCETGAPKIEIALYEYGRSSNSQAAGYIKQISQFTSDLDQLSDKLFKLTINGSEEYCGQVIYTSLNELNWDPSPANYKVIFIAGNEDFLQGTVHYTQACKAANSKGVIVNTIYCGDRLQGIKEHWDLAGECGSGSYTNINHDAKVDDIPTPYDSVLVVLNSKLNKTYLAYGYAGAANYTTQSRMDVANAKLSKSASAKRSAVKANAQLYNNAGWDLVDATRADSSNNFYKTLNRNTLPDSLKNVSQEKLKQVVAEKAKERGIVQSEIQSVVVQRQKYIDAEKAKNAANSNVATLESEVEKIIRAQVKRFKMTIE